MTPLSPFPFNSTPYSLCLLASLVALNASAQSYTFIDLAPTSPASAATAVEGETVVGQINPSGVPGQTRAVIWDSVGNTDLHPAFLVDTVNGLLGRSGVEDVVGDLQVGWAAGPSTANLGIPMAWRGSAASAVALPIPFAHFGGQALDTDGTQIVGYAIGLNRDGTAQGPSHAMIWDATTGAATDLGDGGNGAQVYGVAGGQQVGYVLKGNAIATLWRGARGTEVFLHPKDAVISVANGTDGIRQVGYASYDIRVRAEAAKGNKTARFTYAFLWNGTAASAINIHPYPINAGTIAFTHSYALGLSSTYIVGYATDPAKINSPAYNHAIVWDNSLQSIDLNAFLPADYEGAQAYGVDESGNVAGVATKANGERHAVTWQRNPVP